MSDIDAYILPQDGHAGTAVADQRFVRGESRAGMLNKAGLARPDRYACGVDGSPAGQVCLLAQFGRELQCQRGFETAAKGEMQVHALCELFALHSQQGDVGRIEVQLLLLDCA